MNYLDRFVALGINVTWGTVLVGLVGPGKYPSLLSLREVREIAEWQLVAAVPNGEMVAILAGLEDGDGPDHESLLRTLAAADGIDENLEQRKWRLVLLSLHLDELPEDAIARVLTLTEFWERFDYPPDSPHTVLGRGNRLDPRKYFAPAQVDELVSRHTNWVEAEKVHLRELDEGTPLAVVAR